MLASLLTACLLLAACLHLVVAQDNPTALTMAQTLINNATLRLITTGPRKPSFTGPKGSSKLITYWASGANVEKELLPNGGVKLLTPSNDAAVTLKFSANVTVRTECLVCHPHSLQSLNGSLLSVWMTALHQSRQHHPTRLSVKGKEITTIHD
jgi:hypothetical protein